MGSISDDEMAYMLVELYVKQVAEKGEKKQMGLDTIINAYFYTYNRLRRKKQEMGVLEKAVTEEEKILDKTKAKEILTDWDRALKDIR